MAEQNILSADQSVLEQILSDINEHEENQERLEHIAASIKDITRETDSTTKAMEEEISSRIKESTDSICAGYDKAIACDKDKIKQVQAERDKAKMQGIKERIQTETASLREENKELAGQIEKAFIQENVPKITNNSFFLAKVKGCACLHTVYAYSVCRYSGGALYSASSAGMGACCIHGSCSSTVSYNKQECLY